MSTNIFTSALSGMNAAQVGLSTTEHNIANANTPGFTRQETVVSQRAPEMMGGMFLGMGVDAVGVKRIYDEYLTTQVRQEQTQASYLSTYSTSLKQIDNLLADPSAGAGPAINEFFNAVNGVATNPESIPARQTMLSGAQYAVNRFQAIDQRINEISSGINASINTSVNTINTYARQIAVLNGDIKRAIGAGQGQLPNDLLDQRDLVISKLNQEIKVSVQNQADGTVSVHIGNGQTLVINEETLGLRVVQSNSDPSKLDIAYNSNNTLVTMKQSSFQGGNLGAYLAFRDQTLEPARNAVGRVALGLATSVNQQNRLGQDLKGVLGGDLFKVAAPRVDKGANNGGTAVVSAAISDISAVTTSDYQLRFDGTNYSMVRLSDNFVTNLGATLPQVVDGFTVNLEAGTPAAGDFFLIRPTANVARDLALVTNDPTRIAAAAPMRTSAALANMGSGQISLGAVNAPPPTNINLQATVSIVFTSATAFTVTGAVPAVAGPVAYTPGQDVSYNGWTAQITGTPEIGDTFTVSMNTNASGDSRNALIMAGFQTQNLLENGTTNFQGAYGQLVGEIGAKTQEFDVVSQAQASMVTQSVAAQQSISGVNLDEEAANLLRYQRAYQAAAKALQIAGSMFDALLSLGK